jgi:PAS domain S-box-containing protein
MSILENNSRSLLALVVGPFWVALLGSLMVAGELLGVHVPNPALWFIVLVIVVSLSANLTSIILSNILALAFTVWLQNRVNLLGFSGEPLLRLFASVFAFPAVSIILVIANRRLVRAIDVPAKAERSLFQAVMAAMHDAIVETDWKGIKDVNASFCKMTGFSREELIGAKAPYPFWPPEQYAAIAAALETSMRGQALDFELVLTRKDGTRFPVLLSVSRILETTPDPKTKSSRVLYSFRDITELKRAQESAEQANRTKDRFLNLISHELRSPLTPILTLATLLESDERLTPEVRADMQTIRRNAQVEARLIDELLSLVRTAATRPATDPDSTVRTVTQTINDEPKTTAPTAPIPPLAPPAKKPLNILLVEDHVDTATTMSRLLKLRGHSVTVAATGAAALQFAANTPFDFLISDLGLPDGSGLDLLKNLQKIRPIPAIALSGYASPADIQKSKAAGFLHHLSKPIDFKTLDETIERLA